MQFFSGLNHLAGMFQVWRWRELFVEWVRDLQVAFTLNKLLTHSGQSRLFSSHPSHAPGAHHKGSYGKFWDYYSKYSLFSQAGNHRGKKNPSQAFMRQNLSNEPSWKPILSNFSHINPTPRTPGEGGNSLQNSTLEALGSEIVRSEGWTQRKRRNQTSPFLGGGEGLEGGGCEEGGRGRSSYQRQVLAF